MFDYSLGLMTGIDLPIPELQTVIHQPSIKEISMIGELDFFLGIQLLCIDKKIYIQDEELLRKTTNFQLLISIAKEQDKRNAILQVLNLLFPQADAIFTPRSIILNQDEENIIIDDSNFEFLQEILKIQFCLTGSGQEQFNPKGKKAQEIAQKLLKARKRVAEIKAKSQEGKAKTMFGQYLSVLTVGLNSMSLDQLSDLTMYQLYDLIERYSLYLNWDLDVRSRLAGSTSEKPFEDWMKKIH